MKMHNSMILLLRIALSHSHKQYTGKQKKQKQRLSCSHKEHDTVWALCSFTMSESKCTKSDGKMTNLLPNGTRLKPVSTNLCHVNLACATPSLVYHLSCVAIWSTFVCMCVFSNISWVKKLSLI